MNTIHTLAGSLTREQIATRAAERERIATEYRARFPAYIGHALGLERDAAHWRRKLEEFDRTTFIEV